MEIEDILKYMLTFFQDIDKRLSELSRAQYDIGYSTLYSQEEQDKDIEVLIKGYRELEVKNPALENQNKYWKSVANDSIPKSILKHKKQELEYDQLENPKNIYDNRIKIKFIDELMEDK